jgi:hypothetical protein
VPRSECTTAAAAALSRLNHFAFKSSIRGQISRKDWRSAAVGAVPLVRHAWRV